MKLPIPEWLRGGNDRELARSRYADKEPASTRARSKQAERGSMGRGHRTVAGADRTAQAWEAEDRKRFSR